MVYLFVSSLISSMSYGFLHISFVTLDRFILKYFILFVAIVKGLFP